MRASPRKPAHDRGLLAVRERFPALRVIDFLVGVLGLEPLNATLELLLARLGPGLRPSPSGLSSRYVFAHLLKELGEAIPNLAMVSDLVIPSSTIALTVAVFVSNEQTVSSCPSRLEPRCRRTYRSLDFLTISSGMPSRDAAEVRPYPS